MLASNFCSVAHWVTSSYYDNVGSMRNSGFEIDLHADIIRTKDFKWSMFFNTSLNKSRCCNWQKERKGWNIIQSGRSGSGSRIQFRPIFLMEKVLNSGPGIWRNLQVLMEKEVAMWYVRDDKTGEVSTTTVYSTATYFACGSSQPKMHGGFGGSISWKSFELFFTFVYRAGWLWIRFRIRYINGCSVQWPIPATISIKT